MTNALHDSLANTIDGSYSGSSAKAALSGIADSADNVASAAERARQALLDLLKAQSEEADKKKRILWSGADYSTAVAQASWYGYDKSHVEKNGDMWQVWGYAKGSKKITKDQLAWTQEQGPEMIISPTSGAILTPLKSGDAVIPAEMTSNLWEWGRFNPEEFAGKLLKNADIPNTGNVTTNTMQVGSLVTVNGNVNDSMEMMQIASTTASAKIKQSFKELSNGLSR